MRLQLKSIFPSRDLGWNRVRALCAQPDCHNKLLTRFVPGSRCKYALWPGPRAE